MSWFCLFDDALIKALFVFDRLNKRRSIKNWGENISGLYVLCKCRHVPCVYVSVRHLISVFTVIIHWFIIMITLHLFTLPKIDFMLNELQQPTLNTEKTYVSGRVSHFCMLWNRQCRHPPSFSPMAIVAWSKKRETRLEGTEKAADWRCPFGRILFCIQSRFYVALQLIMTTSKIVVHQSEHLRR